MIVVKKLVAVLGFAVLGFGSLVYGQLPRPTQFSTTPVIGPIAAYAMEDGTDSSGNNRNATLTNTTVTQGKYKNGLTFNGTSSRMTAPSMAFTNAFTLEAWVIMRSSSMLLKAPVPPTVGPAAGTPPLKPSAQTAIGWQAIIYENPDILFLAETGGFLSAGFYSTATNNIAQIVGPTKIQENVWHHVAGVYDGTNLILYVDGVHFAITPATGNLRATTSPMEIGGSQVDRGYLNGTIDDVRIYNRALSISEITSDMNTPVDTVKESISGWDLEIFSKGSDPNLGQPISIATYEKAGVLCNLALTPPPTGTVTNPTTAKLDDPINAGRQCEINAQIQFNSTPLGTGYFATARARGLNGGISARGVVSNSFDRVAEVVPPPPPSSPVIIKK